MISFLSIGVILSLLILSVSSSGGWNNADFPPDPSDPGGDGGGGSSGDGKCWILWTLYSQASCKGDAFPNQRALLDNPGGCYTFIVSPNGSYKSYLLDFEYRDGLPYLTIRMFTNFGCAGDVTQTGAIILNAAINGNNCLPGVIYVNGVIISGIGIGISARVNNPCLLQ